MFDLLSLFQVLDTAITRAEEAIAEGRVPFRTCVPSRPLPATGAHLLTATGNPAQTSKRSCGCGSVIDLEKLLSLSQF
jgi:hypothetical protein